MTHLLCRTYMDNCAKIKWGLKYRQLPRGGLRAHLYSQRKRKIPCEDMFKEAGDV